MFLLRKVLFLLLLQVVAIACISNKKLTILQDQKADKIEYGHVKSFELKDKEYRLKPGDILSVEVFSLTQEKFNFLGTPKLELSVDAEGNVELPVVGNLKVVGLTLGETQQKMKTLTEEYLKDPKVSVKLVNFNFTVLGEVGLQGRFTASNAKLNILEALGQAGGLSDYANRSNIRIIRHEKGQAHVIYVNLLEDNILLSTDYFLEPNDIVMVDPLRAKNVRQQQLGTVSLVFSLLTSVSFLLFQLLN